MSEPEHGEEEGDDAASGEETFLRAGDTITHVDGLRVKGLAALRAILAHLPLGVRHPVNALHRTRSCANTDPSRECSSPICVSLTPQPLFPYEAINNNLSVVVEYYNYFSSDSLRRFTRLERGDAPDARA